MHYEDPERRLHRILKTANRVGNDVISERQIIPVPSFNHQGDLIFTYTRNTNENNDVRFINRNRDSYILTYLVL